MSSAAHSAASPGVGSKGGTRAHEAQKGEAEEREEGNEQEEEEEEGEEEEEEEVGGRRC